MKVFIKRSLWGMLFLLLIIFSLAIYFLNTESGLKQLPKIINKFTALEITYDELSGKILAKQQWSNLKIKLNQKELISADKFILDLSNTSFFTKNINIENLELINSRLNLPETAQEKNHQSEKTEIPKKLPEINIPVNIKIKNLSLKNFAIYSKQQELLSINNLVTTASMLANKFDLDTNIDLGFSSDIDGKIHKNTIKGNARANIQFNKNYPLNLQADIAADLADQKKQNLNLNLQGSLLEPQLLVQTLGDFAKLNLNFDAKIDLEKQQLSSKINAKDASFLSDQIQLNFLELDSNGSFDRISNNLQLQVSGEGIPTSNLNLSTLITPSSLEDIELSLAALEGFIRAYGSAQYGENGIFWNANISLENLNGKNYPPLKDLKLKGSAVSSGEIAAEGLKASLHFEELDGAWQNLPLSANGTIAYATQALTAEELNLNIAGNNLTVDGSFGLPEQILSLQIDADDLGRILPDLAGNVFGSAKVSGSFDKPIIDGQLNWQNLSMRDIFSSDSGKMSISGDLEQLNAKLLAQVYNLPATGKEKFNIQADANANVEELKSLNLNINGLGGQAKITAKAKFKPEFAWHADLNSQNLDLSKILPIKAEIGTNAHVNGKIINGKIDISAIVEKLFGTWQGEQLNANADIKIQDKNILLNKLNLNLGKNSLSANGKILGEKLEFLADSNFSNLSLLYPQLKGELRGKINLNGSFKKPELKTDLQIQNFSFAENIGIKLANIKLNSGMHNNAVFNNLILIEDLNIAGQKQAKVNLQTQGTFQKHQITAKTEGDISSDFSASGGFLDLDAWKGIISSFNLTNKEQHLRLRNPANFSFSPRNINLDKFCAGDEYSNLCLSLNKNNALNLRYQIEKIDPRSLAAFLPKDIKINTVITGNGEISIAENGNASGGGVINLQKGKIIFPTNAAPFVLDIKEAQLNSKMSASGNLLNQLLVDMGSAGVIKANIGINSLMGNKPQLDAEASFNLADIGKFRYLLPQVSVLQGHIDGKFRILGDLAKPHIAGDIVFADGKITVPEFATNLDKIYLAIKSKNDGNFSIDGNVGTPKGSLKTSGDLQLIPLKLNLNIAGDNMQLANSKEMKIIVSPKFLVQITPEKGTDINGEIFIPEAAVSIPDMRSAQGISEDVEIVEDKKKQQKVNSQEKNGSDTAENKTPMRMKMKIRLGDKVFFKNPDMNIRLIGALELFMRNAGLFGRGKIEVAGGTYEIYGQELQIKRGSATFSGNIANPTVDILALRDIGDISAGAQVSGTVKNMRLELTSEPSMPDAAILSYLLTGRAPDSSTDSTALLQTAAALGTRGLFPDDMANKTGLDVFDLGVSGLKAGKYLGSKVYVGMRSDFFESVTQFLARYQINSRLSLEASASQKDGNAVDMLYEFEKN